MKNNIKAILFASLIVALILPFSAMSLADAAPNENASDKAKTNMIDKPKMSTLQKEHIAKITQHAKEQQALLNEGSELKGKYQKDNKSVTAEELETLQAITDRLAEIRAEVGVINAESVALHAISPEELKTLVNAQKQLQASDIPVGSNGVDNMAGALVIQFPTQAEADKNAQALEELLDVPFYTEIGIEENYACATRSSDCDPLQGGIQIATETSTPGVFGDCSYSIPAVRNVFWWTETGFVTAGHCFESSSGWDVTQPFGGSGKIGDLTKRVYDHNGECDCAFVEKSGSESTLFGYWNGHQLYTKGDPSVGSYVWVLGHNSADWGYVSSNTWTSSVGGVDILNTLKLNYAATGNGDSGGIVYDFTTNSVYNGLIKSGVGSSYTVAIPWTHIDNGLDLQ